MGDALAEGLGAAELGIHVVGEEIPRMAGMDDDVGLGDRAAQGLPCRADHVVLEKLLLLHLSLLPLAPIIFFHKKAFDK